MEDQNQVITINHTHQSQSQRQVTKEVVHNLKRKEIRVKYLG